MLCKKSAQTNSSGRFIIATEALITASEHLLTDPEHLPTAPEHFHNCFGTLRNTFVTALWHLLTTPEHLRNISATGRLVSDPEYL